MSSPSASASSSSSNVVGGERTTYPDFFQESPRLGNSYLDDNYLNAILTRLLRDITPEQRATIEADLVRFGGRCSTDLLAMSNAMEANPPYLIQYDSWGRRIDDLVTCREWKQMHVVAAEEGLIAHGYTRDYGARSRIYQFAKLYMFTPSSGLYNCPLAMTDGATRLCEILLNPHTKLSSVTSLPAESRQQIEAAYRHLTSRDGAQFWSSGQWMTERGGGSDVGNGTTSVARLQPDGTYKLYGFKWFTSATDAEMTVTLARIEDSEGRTTPGSRGLTCFFLRVKRDDGTLNHIKIQKLKNKLGTKQLPTAELELAGSVAYRLSDPGRGVALISTLINVTRVYNAINCCGFIRRMVALMRDYAHRRTVFGKTLAENSMHLEMLAEVEVQSRAATCFTFDVVDRLGRTEVPSASTEEDQAMLRLLTPLVKLYTGKQVTAVGQECIESFGGQGYIEDSKIPRMFRDSNVLAIWEGTTNVLSHDLLRVLTSSKGAAFKVFHTVVERRIKEAEAQIPKLSSAMQPRITKATSTLRTSLNELATFVTKAMTDRTQGMHALEQYARQLAFGMSRVYIASSLAVHAIHTKLQLDWVTFERWTCDADSRQTTAASPLVPNVLREPIEAAATRAEESRQLALDIDPKSKEPRGYGDRNKDGSLRSRL